MNKIQEDENFFKIFETLWDGKFKIIFITILTVLMGYSFSRSLPESYNVTTPIYSGDPSVFFSYRTVNDVLKDKDLLFHPNENPNGYSIYASTIFEKFIEEFNDYEEMISVLSEEKFVTQLTQGLNDIAKRRVLIKLAKSFVIVPSKKQKSWFLTFNWHDDDEGRRLFNDALVLTIKNTQKKIIGDVEKLAASIDFNNFRKLEIFHNELDLVYQRQIEIDNKRIKFLTEHSAIANELGIEKNTVDPNLLFSSESNSFATNRASMKRKLSNRVSLKIMGDKSYYLRGFKAIEKEIMLIKNRTSEERLLMSRDYIVIKNDIAVLKNDLSSSQLRDSLKIIKNHDPRNWVKFDLSLANSKSLKKSKLYIVLSIMMGGILGSMYVIISNILKKRREQF